jgi:response regulator of citrate/malate metabolism
MKNNNIKIAIIENDLCRNKVLTGYVNVICADNIYKDVKFDIKSFTNAKDCIMQLECDLDIILIDYYLLIIGDTDVLIGEDVVAYVRAYCPTCEIVVISSQEDDEMLAKLIKEGVTEHIDKRKDVISRIEHIIRRFFSEA